MHFTLSEVQGLLRFSSSIPKVPRYVIPELADFFLQLRPFFLGGLFLKISKSFVIQNILPKAYRIVGPTPNPQKLADNRPLLIQHISNTLHNLGYENHFKLHF